jgi:hypothetical protein
VNTTPLRLSFGIPDAPVKLRSVFALRIDMKSTAQESPVETWESEPELKVVEQTGAKAGTKGSKAKLAPPRVVGFRSRPELEVLSWEIRSGRLTKSGNWLHS